MGKSCQSLLFPQFLTLSELFRTALWKLKLKKMYDGNTSKGSSKIRVIPSKLKKENSTKKLAV